MKSLSFIKQKSLFYIKHYIKVLGRLIIYPFPRDKHLIVYGGVFDLFIDNCKYLFIYNNVNFKGYRHVWLTKNRKLQSYVQSLGFKAVYSKSIKGVYLTLRAKNIIFDDAVFFYTWQFLISGANRIELWHGIPLKMYCRAYMENQPPYTVKNWFQDQILDDHMHGTYAVSTSKRLDTINSATFGVPINRLIHASLPRTRILLMTESERWQFINKYESPAMVDYYDNLKSETRKKIIYMPTFRDANPNYINETIPDWNDLNEYCKTHDILLFLKVHRAAMSFHNTFSNIEILDNMMDIYPLLPLYDLLITDYSSIMYDYALMDKPVLLYTYDIEDYMKHSRPLYNDFHQLRKEMTEVSDYESLKTAMVMNDSDIKRLPVHLYYDCPEDIESINVFIRGC